MIEEKALLELLQDSIKQDFFGKGFLRGLYKTIAGKLGSKEGEHPAIW
jgi:hypothetical protein